MLKVFLYPFGGDHNEYEWWCCRCCRTGIS
jgi:hypothetical protein